MSENEDFEQLTSDADALQSGAQYEPEFADLWPGQMPPEEALPPVVGLGLYGGVGAALVAGAIFHRFLATYAIVAPSIAALLAVPEVFRWPPLSSGAAAWQRIRTRRRAAKRRRIQRRVAFAERGLRACTTCGLVSLGLALPLLAGGGIIAAADGSTALIKVALALLALGFLLPFGAWPIYELLIYPGSDATSRGVRVVSPEDLAGRLEAWQVGRWSLFALLVITGALAGLAALFA
jgi:hypothetical protein